MNKPFDPNLLHGVVAGGDLARLVSSGAVYTGFEDSRIVDLNAVAGVTVDVRLGDVMMTEDHSDGKLMVVSVLDRENSLVAKEHERLTKDCHKVWHLKPNEFVLTKTAEYFDLPSNIMGIFTLRSVAARHGLDQVTSLILKAGFKGQLVLELKNNRQNAILELCENDIIGQVVFIKHDETTPYNGSYQNQ